MKIEYFPATNVVYRRRIGVYGLENKKLMEEVKETLEKQGYLDSNSVILGIPRDNPEITRESDCRYDVGLIVEKMSEFKDPTFEKEQIPAGKYLVLRIPHTAEEVSRALPRLFTELAEKGYHYNPVCPIIEKYSGKLLTEEQCEICLPIK